MFIIQGHTMYKKQRIQLESMQLWLTLSLIPLKISRRAITYNVTSIRVRVTIVCRRKTISVTYSERVFAALVIQHVKRMRRIILLSVAYLAPFISISVWIQFLQFLLHNLLF